jgi:putative ABC transport system ATP-binding protein
VPALQAIGLSKVYGSGDTAVAALDDVDVTFAEGMFHAVMGASGSGKSTLMHCLAGLDRPTSGTVRIFDTDLSSLRDEQLTRLRRDHVGFVFQKFNLLPVLSAQENILLPLSIAGRRVDEPWFDQVVAAVGLTDRLGHRPAELSGGQQQRVAVARALITRPWVVFADEPTGNLDSRSGAEVLGLLRDAVALLGQTVVMVTHDLHAAAHCDRVVFLSDGRYATAVDKPDAARITATLEHVR